MSSFFNVHLGPGHYHASSLKDAEHYVYYVDIKETFYHLFCIFVERGL